MESPSKSLEKNSKIKLKLENDFMKSLKNIKITLISRNNKETDLITDLKNTKSSFK